MICRPRLGYTAASSFVAILLFKVWLDAWVFLVSIRCSCLPFWYSLYNFRSSGVVNAFNLIDGLNGLASYVTVSVAVSLSIIAFKAGNAQVSIFLVLCVATVLGFMVLNFSLGKIFL